MADHELLSRARRIAAELLLPAALAVDAADRVPETHFDALAAAGLYGLAGPVQAGGLGADPATFCGVIEIMASGCLAPAFVWLQHHSAVRALASTANAELSGQWLGPLCRGERRAGVALAGARPGPPLLRAWPVPGGFCFDGTAPWVTGWGEIDVLYTVARQAGGGLVAALVPAVAARSLAAERLSLVAVNASRTVELSFDRHFVPSEQVSGTIAEADWLAADAAGLRPNGSLSLGVAARCCEFIRAAGRTESADVLAGQLAAAREALDQAGVVGLPAARATAADLAFRAAGALVTLSGSRSVRTGQHPQRLAREALFLLVFAARPAIREHLASLLSGPPASE